MERGGIGGVSDSRRASSVCGGFGFATMAVCGYKAVVVAEYAVMVDNKMIGIEAVADWRIPFLYS